MTAVTSHLASESINDAKGLTLGVLEPRMPVPTAPGEVLSHTMKPPFPCSLHLLTLHPRK